MHDKILFPTLLALACLGGAGGGALFQWLAAPQSSETITAPVASFTPSEDEPAAQSNEGLDRLNATVDVLAQRVESLESAARRTPAAATRVPEVAMLAEDGPEAAPPSAEPEESTEDLRAMLGRVLGHGPEGATPEEEARFWELARTSDVVKQLLAELEAQVEARPHDPALRLELAQAYVAKLLTVPGGPERGIWGMRAEEQWREAARIEPDNWEAHFALGENFSYYPSFLNKSVEALSELERARELQEQRPAEARFAETYVLLARTYLARGAKDEARAALEAGLGLHPDSAELREALAALGR